MSISRVATNVGLGAIAGSAEAIKAMCDKNKGSLSNRAECAKEHLKNDVGTIAKLGLAGGAVYAAKKTTVNIASLKTFAEKIAAKVGKEVPSNVGKVFNYKPFNLLNTIKNGAGKALAWVANKLPKNGVLGKISNKILANPAKAGAIGLTVAGSIWVINTIAKNIYNTGKINQKYEDLAKIDNFDSIV